MRNKQLEKKVLGERLKAFREEKGLTAYKVALMGGLHPGQVKAVESGQANYTIDIFMSYLHGCGLHMFFFEKDEDRSYPHDFEDMIKKKDEGGFINIVMIGIEKS
jgi:transcriptional regulator with XRE-family HTH domain